MLLVAAGIGCNGKLTSFTKYNWIQYLNSFCVRHTNNNNNKLCAEFEWEINNTSGPGRRIANWNWAFQNENHSKSRSYPVNFNGLYLIRRDNNHKYAWTNWAIAYWTMGPAQGPTENCNRPVPFGMSFAYVHIHYKRVTDGLGRK